MTAAAAGRAAALALAVMTSLGACAPVPRPTTPATTTPAPSPGPPDAGAPAGGEGVLDAVTLAGMKEQPAPVAGLAVEVVRRGRTLLRRGYGFADVQARLPMTPDAVFRIGSITKQFTAAAVMRLVGSPPHPDVRSGRADRS